MNAWGGGEVSATNAQKAQKIVHCLKENAMGGDFKVNYLYCVVIYNALDSIDSIVKRRAVWLGFLHSPRLALLLPPVSSLRGVDKFHHSSIILP